MKINNLDSESSRGLKVESMPCFRTTFQINLKKETPRALEYLFFKHPVFKPENVYIYLVGAAMQLCLS